MYALRTHLIPGPIADIISVMSLPAMSFGWDRGRWVVHLKGANLSRHFLIGWCDENHVSVKNG